MKTRFNSAREHLSAWGQEGFATLRSTFLWPGGWRSNLSQPQEKKLSYGQQIIKNTPLPRKRQWQQIPFWLIIAVIAAAIFTGWFLLWLWWGNLPRAY